MTSPFLEITGKWLLYAIVALLCLQAVRNMLRQLWGMYHPKPRDTSKPAKYVLKPENVIAFRFLGQAARGVCRDPECRWSILSTFMAHVHREYGFTPVRFGDWIVEREGRAGVSVMSHEQFSNTYDFDGEIYFLRI
jgi:hypothetical protein